MVPQRSGGLKPPATTWEPMSYVLFKESPTEASPPHETALEGGGMALLCFPPKEIGKWEASSLGCAALPGSGSPGAESGAGGKAGLSPSRLSRKRGCVGRRRLNTGTQT